MGAIFLRTKALAAGGERRLPGQLERRGEAASAGLLLVAASSAILPGGQIHPPV